MRIEKQNLYPGNNVQFWRHLNGEITFGFAVFEGYSNPVGEYFDTEFDAICAARKYIMDELALMYARLLQLDRKLYKVG